MKLGAVTPQLACPRRIPAGNWLAIRNQIRGRGFEAVRALLVITNDQKGERLPVTPAATSSLRKR